ncbi:unnamed protein product [Symbiodinium pilosum]|uniref:GYF domain-containing protein n=1 Tax=Symbiodinium pilosum TaxID=2952 RepID=A0A812Q5I7_SYMPI|nr:unnamed protein product [Symbiodinium pilosum]
MGDPDRLQWYYVDRTGQEFGPFRTSKMRSWFSQGFFPIGDELLVRLGDWPPEAIHVPSESGLHMRSHAYAGEVCGSNESSESGAQILFRPASRTWQLGSQTSRRRFSRDCKTARPVCCMLLGTYISYSFHSLMTPAVQLNRCMSDLTDSCVSLLHR